MNKQVVLKTRPEGAPALDNFAVVSRPMPDVPEGHFLVRNRYLGLAPSSRIRMTESPFYAAPTPLEGVVHGQTLGDVVQSRHPEFTEGDTVILIDGGLQEYSLGHTQNATKITPASVPETAWLGALGASGMTAFVGLFDIGQIRRGDTVVISAATGGVGAIAGQIARNEGCKVIGIAGGPKKCQHAIDDLKFDACIDYRSSTFEQDLKAATGGTIDVYFDNVGGDIRAACYGLMADFGRIVVCGMISEYNQLGSGHGPDWFPILSKRLTVRGFLLGDHTDRLQAFLDYTIPLVSSGAIFIKEDISEGIDTAAGALIGMLKGDNFGKTIVKL